MSAIPTHNLVDAAGSGDWLAAGLIHGLRNHKPLDRLTEEKLEQALDFGQTLASLNCNYEGARGMMYNLSKEKPSKIATRQLKNRTEPAELILRHSKRNELISKLALECKVCLYTR